jgi:hypothetical protein
VRIARIVLAAVALAWVFAIVGAWVFALFWPR